MKNQTFFTVMCVRAAMQAPAEISMTTADGADDKGRGDRGTSLERYLQMDEKEKDVEIQKAVVRLQKRIQEILYFFETEKQHVINPELKGKD